MMNSPSHPTHPSYTNKSTKKTLPTLVISLPIHPRRILNSPILLHPQLLHPILPIQKTHNTFVHRLQVLGGPGRYLDGQSRTSHDCEVMPLGFVGVLYRAQLVEDLGTANVELLDLYGEGTVSGLGFFDGDIVFFLEWLEMAQEGK